MAAASDSAPSYRLWLNRIVVQRVGEYVPQRFIPAGPRRLELQLGNARWSGQEGKSHEEAQENAAKEAYKELAFLTGGQIRQKLGMGPRKRLIEADVMRTALFSLDTRIRASITREPQKSVAIEKLTFLRTLVATSEQELLHLGLPGYPAEET
jgi:hypothetical protein